MVTLYTTGCPRCKVLALKLEQAEIPYQVSHDVEDLIEAGIYSVPGLKVDGTILNFTEANNWIKEQVDGNN